MLKARMLVRCALPLLAANASLSHADGLRVCSWNVTNYGSNDSGRNQFFQTAFYATFQGRTLAPDVVIGQEFNDNIGVTNFRNMLNAAPGSPGDWASAILTPASPAGGSSNAFFYRTSKVTFLGQQVLTAGTGSGSDQPPRNNHRYLVRLNGYTGTPSEVYMYFAHMKAGSSQSDQNRRTPEAERIAGDVATLPAGANYLLAGDFNTQSSLQTAYQVLLTEFTDPIRRPGTWNNSGSFRTIHTQDPAGEMDDRHDQILISSTLDDGAGMSYLPDNPTGNVAFPYSSSTWNDPNHSYRSWGNDGSGNGSSSQLAITGNTMVGATIAAALRDSAAGGGHLPVVMNLSVPAIIDVATSDIDFGNADPLTTSEITLDIGNVGDTVLWGPNGIDRLTYSFSTTGDFSAPGGTFEVAAGDAPNQHTIAMDTTTAGSKSGTLTINSDDPSDPSIVINLTGTVGSLGEIELRFVVSDDMATGTDTGPVTISDPTGGTTLYVQARIINEGGIATGLTTFDGQISDDLSGVFAPSPLTITEATGLPFPGLDIDGRAGMLPSYRATIGNNNDDIGNGQLVGGEFLILPLNINPAGNGEGIGGNWSTVYKLDWSSSDPTPRTVQLGIDALVGGYQAPGGLVQPIPIVPGSIDLAITGVAGCPCEFDGVTGAVDVLDLLAFLGQWFGETGSPIAPGTGTDYDGSGFVDVVDLLAFLGCWFPASAGSPCP